jgi:hypothetical protein
MTRHGRATPLVWEGAEFLAATFSDHAGSRPYKLYVPSGYRAGSLFRWSSCCTAAHSRPTILPPAPA